MRTRRVSCAFCSCIGVDVAPGERGGWWAVVSQPGRAARFDRQLRQSFTAVVGLQQNGDALAPPADFGGAHLLQIPLDARPGNAAAGGESSRLYGEVEPAFAAWARHVTRGRFGRGVCRRGAVAVLDFGKGSGRGPGQCSECSCGHSVTAERTARKRLRVTGRGSPAASSRHRPGRGLQDPAAGPPLPAE